MQNTQNNKPLLGDHHNINDINGEQKEQKEQKESDDGHVSIAKKPVYTITLLVLSVLASLAVFISYGLFIQKQKTEYRITYDVSILMLIILVIAICLIYFWEYLYEPIYFKMHPQLLLNKNNPDAKEKKRSRNLCDRNFCAVISEEINRLQLTQNTLSAFMCIIHQIFLAILTWSGIINGNADPTYIITGFVSFFEAFSITLPGFALTTFCEGRETINEEKNKGSVLRASKSHVSYESKHLASQQSIFKDGSVVYALFFTLLVQFVIFVTYPTVNHDNFKSLTFVIYNCESAASCSHNPFFIINEILFRLFVGITLLDAMFLTVSNLLGDTIHHSSLKYIYSVLNPCIWPLVAILALCEIDVLYTSDNKLFEDVIDWIWIGIHGIAIFMAISFIIHSKNVYSERLEEEIEKFYQMNKLHEKSMFMQGAIVWLLYVVYYLFLFLSADAEVNWSVMRQGVVLLFLTFEAMTLYYIKQCENHPKFRKYFMKYRHGKKIRCINWIYVLQCIAVLNLYDLINSFIFEISHFIELFQNSDEDMSAIFFRIAFSFSFAGSHFNFWCLSLVIGVLYRYYFAQINDHVRAKDVPNENIKISMDVPSTNGSEKQHIIGTERQISHGSNVIKRQKFVKKVHKGNKIRKKKRKFKSKSISLQLEDDSASVTSCELNQYDKYDDIQHMISNNKDQVSDGSLSQH